MLTAAAKLCTVRQLFGCFACAPGPSKRVKNEKSTSFEIEESALLKLENLCRWEARLGANSSTQRRVQSILLSLKVHSLTSTTN